MFSMARLVQWLGYLKLTSVSLVFLIWQAFVPPTSNLYNCDNWYSSYPGHSKMGYSVSDACGNILRTFLYCSVCILDFFVHFLWICIFPPLFLRQKSEFKLKTQKPLLWCEFPSASWWKLCFWKKGQSKLLRSYKCETYLVCLPMSDMVA